MRRLTAKMLVGHGACAIQVRRFRRVFPRGAAVTEANFLKAAHAGLDYNWAAVMFLDGHAARAWRRDRLRGMG